MTEVYRKKKNQNAFCLCLIFSYMLLGLLKSWKEQNKIRKETTKQSYMTIGW